MSLDALLKDIDNSVKKEIEAINKETSEKIKVLLDEKKSKEKEIKKDLEQKYKIESKKIEERETSSLAIEKKRILLKEKEALMKILEENIEEKIKSMDSKSREKMLSALLKVASNQLKDGKVVYVSKKDEALLRKISKDYVVKASEIEAGLILESKDGIRRVDLSLNELKNDLISKNMFEINKYFVFSD